MPFKTFRKVFRDLIKLDRHLRFVNEHAALNARKFEGFSPTSSQQLGALNVIRQTHPAVKAISRLFVVGDGVVQKAGSLCGQIASKFFNARRFSALPMFGAFGILYTGAIGGTQKPVPKADIEEFLTLIQMRAQDKLVQDSSDEPESSARLEDYNLKERLGKPSSCAAIYSAEYNGNEFAMKIMFNYGFPSNSNALLMGFERECRVLTRHTKTIHEDKSLVNCLPEHPNVIKVLNVLTEKTPCLHDSIESYPSALPPRLFSKGFGRNKTLCLVMPRYDCTLKDYVQRRPLSECESISLISQLLEGVAHLVDNYEAHRDLKSDNILIKFRQPGCPQLVITDFGCCLGDESLKLQLPFNSYHVDRGGNRALMAPEIASMEPGPGNVLDYSKSDVWACGAIAYEIFGSINPFMSGQLDSILYSETELPVLQCDNPLIGKTIQLLLKRDPDERPSAAEAITMMMLIMYAPPYWLLPDWFKIVDDAEIIKWLLKIGVQALNDEREMCLQNMPMPVDLSLRMCFLLRANCQLVRSALTYLNT